MKHRVRSRRLFECWGWSIAGLLRGDGPANRIPGLGPVGYLGVEAVEEGVTSMTCVGWEAGGRL